MEGYHSLGGSDSRPHDELSRDWARSIPNGDLAESDSFAWSIGRQIFLSATVVDRTVGKLHVTWSSLYKDKDDLTSTVPFRSQSNLKPGLMDALDSVRPLGCMRLVVLHYTFGGFPDGEHHEGAVKNKDVLETIYAKINVHPGVFYSQLGEYLEDPRLPRCARIHARYARSLASAWLDWLPSYKDWIDLRTESGAVSAAIEEDKDGKPSQRAVIVEDCNSRPPGQFLRDLFHHPWLSKDPHWFAYPLLERMMSESTRACCRNDYFLDLGPPASGFESLVFNTRNTFCRHQSVRRQRIGLQNAFGELETYWTLRFPYDALPTDAKQLMLNFHKVRAEIMRVERMFEQDTQLGSGVTAAEEAARSLKQGASVRRLTVIASVFIPFSFSASFFGMNLAQLNNTGPQLQYFFILGLATIFASFFLIPYVWAVVHDFRSKTMALWASWAMPHKNPGNRIGCTQLVKLTLAKFFPGVSRRYSKKESRMRYQADMDAKRAGTYEPAAVSRTQVWLQVLRSYLAERRSRRSRRGERLWFPVVADDFAPSPAPLGSLHIGALGGTPRPPQVARLKEPSAI